MTHDTLSISLPGSPVTLRRLAMTDLDRTLRWHNDAGLYRTLGSEYRSVSRDTEAAWLRRVSTPAPDSLNLAICIAESGEHVGNIYLKAIDLRTREAELHIFVGDAMQRGRGYGAAAVTALLHHAVTALGLRRITLEVLVDNLPAIQVYRRCGFVETGVHRNQVVKEGMPKDVMLMTYEGDRFA